MWDVVCALTLSDVCMWSPVWCCGNVRTLRKIPPTTPPVMMFRYVKARVGNCVFEHSSHLYIPPAFNKSNALTKKIKRYDICDCHRTIILAFGRNEMIGWPTCLSTYLPGYGLSVHDRQTYR